MPFTLSWSCRPSQPPRGLYGRIRSPNGGRRNRDGSPRKCVSSRANCWPRTAARGGRAGAYEAGINRGPGRYLRLSERKENLALTGGGLTMSLALTDRPATQARTVEPRTQPLVVDPVLDGPARPAHRPSVQRGSEAACQRERVPARARRRRWAIRAACAVPVVAAVLAAPAQPGQVQASPSPGPAATASSAAPSLDVRASSSRPAVCSPLPFLPPAGSRSCLFSPATAGQPLP